MNAKPRCLVVIILVLAVQACYQTPYTKRKALILVPFSQELTLGEQAYQEILSNANLSNNARWTGIVERIGKNIAHVSDMPDLQWEYRLIESPEKNAFCLPGGKVGVYTGIMEVAQNEAGLAAIVGHEVAHAVARHGAQRMSQAMLLNLGLSLADVSLQNNQHRDLIMAALGFGANVGVVLPYSRNHEREADEIGTIYMAKAGYDPYEAAALWERFADAKNASAPTFFSTHPSSHERAQSLRVTAQTAMAHYEKAVRQYGKGESLF